MEVLAAIIVGSAVGAGVMFAVMSARRKEQPAPVAPASMPTGPSTTEMLATPKPDGWSEEMEYRFQQYVARGGPRTTPWPWVAPDTREKFLAVRGQPLELFDPNVLNI